MVWSVVNLWDFEKWTSEKQNNLLMHYRLSCWLLAPSQNNKTSRTHQVLSILRHIFLSFFFPTGCRFTVLMRLGKLQSVKCKMDYLIIKIIQDYESIRNE